MRDIYEARQERDNLWIIGERYKGPRRALYDALTICLVVGEHTAAVLDSGLGISRELRAVCESITDKPLICLVGHCHPDHAGGAAQFDKVFMSPLDGDQLVWTLSREKRLMTASYFSGGDEELVAYVSENLMPEESFEFEGIRDGDRFDLGGTVLEAVAMPGHTLGSMCFVNWRDNYAYTSDCMNPTEILGTYSKEPTVLPTPLESYPVAAYRDNLRRFLALVPDTMMLYMGHISQPTTTQVPKGLLAVCDDIIAGAQGKEVPRPPFVDEMFRDRKCRYSRNRAGLIYNEDCILG